MPDWVPQEFRDIVARVRSGERPRVTVRELLAWFDYRRRGAQANRYILGVMQQQGVRCTPSFEAAYPEDEIEFTSIAPIDVLQPAPTPAPAPGRPAPYPSAIFALIVPAQTEVSRRVRARLDAIERTIAYFAVAQLAALRDHAGGSYPEAIHQALADYLPDDDGPGAPLSFGAWVMLARTLAALTSASSTDPVFRAARALVARTDRRSPLAARLSEQAVRTRNEIMHGSNLPVSVYETVAPSLEALAAELDTALAPLMGCELVCVARTKPGDREAYAYELRSLHGSNEYFPTREFETSHKLSERWAYLLRDGAAPLRLAPGVFCVTDPATERVQIFLARSLALDPGQRIELKPLVGEGQRKEPLPR